MSTYLQNIDLVRQDLEGLPHLEERFQFLLDALDEKHPGRIIDEAKCFLESIFRTINISYHGAEDKERIYRLRMPELFTEVSQVVCLSDDETVSHQLREMCDLQFTRIGSIRNAEGAAAHGRDGYHEAVVGLPEALYIAQSAVAIGTLFFSRYQALSDWRTNKRQRYEDNPEFNNWFDDQNEMVKLAGVEMLPSEVLFNNDLRAYREALVSFYDSPEDLLSALEVSEHPENVANRILNITQQFKTEDLIRLSEIINEQQEQYAVVYEKLKESIDFERIKTITESIQPAMNILQSAQKDLSNVINNLPNNIFPK